MGCGRGALEYSKKMISLSSGQYSKGTPFNSDGEKGGLIEKKVGGGGSYMRKDSGR